MDNFDNYVELAAAIIRSACEDYIKYRRLQEKRPNDKSISANVRTLCKFFYGKNFAILSMNNDPDYFVELLEARV